MMDATLAQLLNHIFELEIENVQLKQRFGLLPTQGEDAEAPQEGEVNNGPDSTSV